MINVSELKQKFDLLPVDKNNWSLYQNLLDLDMSVFKPLMEEILEGRMDIEDTRPIFSKYMPRVVNAVRNEVENKRRLINTEEEFRQNLVRRALTPDEAIKEVRVANPAYDDIKGVMIDKYEEATGDKLTESQRRAMLIAMEQTQYFDIDLYGNKEKQVRLSDMLSGSPS